MLHDIKHMVSKLRRLKNIKYADIWKYWKGYLFFFSLFFNSDVFHIEKM